ncbi:MAG: [FeFe] hydrogenase H-cluster radical SAM maturase HydG, partial [Thermodesulfobacteriota bacterium]
MTTVAEKIIDTEEIESILSGVGGGGGGGGEKLSRILERAGECRGLSLEEAAVLLSVEEPETLERIYQKAGEVKLKIFGRRVVLFAPLYLSNHCSNGCLYCGFRSANRELPRKALSEDEVVAEARTLEGLGFKRILMVLGEDAATGLDYILRSVRAVYCETGIRIVHLNAPPMGVDELKELKKAGVGVYQAFQETYHRPTYERMHPTGKKGKKSDYDRRLGVMTRALRAGFEDVGIGPLLGLYDYKYDSLATIAHTRHLYDEFGTHAHTISVPRLRPAEGSALGAPPHPVTDEELKKTVAVFRLAVPTAGVVVSTRESAPLRKNLIHIGASQLSAASRTAPGGYTAAKEETLKQFATEDHASLGEVMASIAAEGFLPSLCTTCYRTGRVGSNFNAIATAGGMKGFCQANAILTLKEYLLDTASNGRGEALEKALDLAMD